MDQVDLIYLQGVLMGVLEGNSDDQEVSNAMQVVESFIVDATPEEAETNVVPWSGPDAEAT